MSERRAAPVAAVVVKPRGASTANAAQIAVNPNSVALPSPAVSSSPSSTNNNNNNNTPSLDRSPSFPSSSSQPAHWVPDSAVNGCMRCDASFSAVRRKHHCRCCGFVVCDKCSQHRIILMDQLSSGKVRVCNLCYQISGVANDDHEKSSPTHSPQSSPITPHDIQNFNNPPSLHLSNEPGTPVRRTSDREQREREHRGGVGYNRDDSDEQREAQRLDLPLRLCLMILKKSAVEMRERYANYQKTKKERGDIEDPLSFSQFMFLSTIRTLPNFVFKKTELAYWMMKSDDETLTGAAGRSTQYFHEASVSRENFIRYAPILSIASKIDAPKVFDALSAATSSSSRGLSFDIFKTYVEALRHRVKSNEESWGDFRSAFSLEKNEEMLLWRGGITEVSSFPPQVGRLALTNNHLIFEGAFFRRRKCWSWHDIDRIEKTESTFLRRVQMKLIIMEEDLPEETKGRKTEKTKEEKLREKERRINALGSASSSSSPHPTLFNRGKPVKQVEVIFELSGFGSDIEKERIRTYSYVNAIITAHKLAGKEKDKIKAAAIVFETCETIKRMRSLESMTGNIDPLVLDPFSDGTNDEKESYAATIAQFVEKSESIRKSKQNWLYKVLPGLQTNGNDEKSMQDIDPELSMENYKRIEESAKKSSEAEPFSIKGFIHNIRLCLYLLQPVFAFFALLKKLRNWDSPIATIVTIILLLNMAYKDLLSYLPSLFLLTNLILLAILKINPYALVSLLSNNDEENNKEKQQGDGDDETSTVLTNDATTIAAATVSSTGSTILVAPAPNAIPINAPPASPPLSPSGSFAGPGSIVAPPVIPASVTAAPVRISSPSPNTGRTVDESKDRDKKNGTKKESGLLQKIKEYADAAYRTQSKLENVQNNVSDFNIKLMKIEGLYKWRTPRVSQHYFGILFAAFLVMTFIPFRLIFPIIVIDFFTTKWQREGSTLDRIIAEVALPEEMPVID